MKFKKSLLGTVVSMAVATNAMSLEIETSSTYQAIDKAELVANSLGVVGGPVTATNKSEKNVYIVRVNGETGINRASRIGELVSSNPGSLASNNYNPHTPRMASYIARMQEKQAQIAGIQDVDIIHHYYHTFNGFAARMTAQQAEALANNRKVASVYLDELLKIDTANTPEWLGLVDSDGNRVSEYDGEGVIVGIVDSGIAPDNPSFADDDEENSYTDPDTLGWAGACNIGDLPGTLAPGSEEDGEIPPLYVGDDEEFTCNNKLIGAKYFGSVFDSVYGVQTELGEFISPRDADGHGSHTAGTAAGNAGVDASIYGNPVGTVSGIAPRARVAAYKVCWNSNYVAPNGADEAGCFGGDSMMAIDTAVADGVDVINYSISGSRTSLIAPQTLAMLNAEDAGVFVSVSAGNSGPTAVTVGTPAPWVTSVAASTYDGERLTGSTNILEVTSSDPVDELEFFETAFSAPLALTGAVEGNLVIAEPLLGCYETDEEGADVITPLDNAEDIEGNIALISRGACAFVQKVNRAQLAGASAVVIYSTDDSPFAGGGSSFFSDIPAGMIGLTDGTALNAAITGGEEVTVKLPEPDFTPVTEEGDLIAGFSSRGPNGSTTDLIKPDITAPGVNILAPATDTPMFGPQGEEYQYLSGTSMSAPHIAGFAALLTQEHPEWSPTQIKSALMTTARQDLTKQESGEAADPFDFGAGHAVPLAASTPGLTYNAGYDDYLGFLCGLGETAAVLSESKKTCDEVTETISDDLSQLNYPSIAIGEFSEEETIFRTVTDVTGLDSTYSYLVEAPAGIDVTVNLDSGTDGDMLEVAANGSAGYSVTFTATEDTVVNEWVFGSITFTNEADGTKVRSPIAIFPVPTIKVDVPDAISTTLNRGRTSFPVQMLYSGTTSLDYAGLAAPFTFGSETVGQDPDQSFTPFEAEQAIYGIQFFEGTQVARFTIAESLTSAPGTDLDLFVYFRPFGGADEFVDSSALGGSDETVVIANPRTSEEGFYIVFINGWFVPEDEDGNETVTTVPLNWSADPGETSTRVSGSTRAIEGRFNHIRVITSDLPNSFGFPYMGGVTFYDDEGNFQGTTVLEIQP